MAAKDMQKKQESEPNTVPIERLVEMLVEVKAVFPESELVVYGADFEVIQMFKAAGLSGVQKVLRKK